MIPTGSIAVMYHYVRDVEETPFAAIRAVSPAGFAAQLDWLRDRFDVIDYPRFERALLDGAPPGRPAALLTFDDGFVDHHRHVYPALRARGWTGVFFLAGAALPPLPALLNVHKTHFLLARLGAAAFVDAVMAQLERLPQAVALETFARRGIYRYDGEAEHAAKRLLNYELPFEAADAVLDALFRAWIGDPAAFARDLYLSDAMIREMAAAGMTFGFHTESHPVLSRLSNGRQQAELRDGVRRIRELTGQARVPFCYPYGHAHTYTPETKDLLAEAGYATAFTTDRRPIRFDAGERYDVPRFDTNDLPPAGLLQMNSTGG